MIYFDKQHNAYGDELSIIGKEIVFTCEDSLWIDFQTNDGKYIWVNDEIVPNPNYEQEETEKRQVDFESKFLATSLGNYRLQPKGYANAQQSIDTVNALVTYSQGLTEQVANKIIFYATPDFTKPEECTEEWLVEHQSHPQPMTLQEWGAFYIEFSTAYANKMYQKEMEGV